MKKYLVSIIGLVLLSVIMVGCSSKSEAFLEQGSIWLYPVTPTDTRKLTIVDETHWKYEDAHTPEPITIVLEKKEKDYYGYPAYDVIDSGGVSFFLEAKREEGMFIVPIDKNGLKQMDLQRPRSKDWSENKIKKQILSVAEHPEYTKQAYND